MFKAVLLISSLILSVAVIFIIATIERMFNGVKLIDCEESGQERKLYRFRFINAFVGVKREGWLKAALIGIVVGAINFFAPMAKGVLWLEPIFLAIMLGLMVYLVVWWHQNGLAVKEMICFILLEGLFYQVAKVVVQMMRILVKDVFWMSFIAKLPLMLLIFCIGFFIVDKLFFHYRNLDDDKKATVSHVFAWIIMILVTLALLLMLIFGVRWGALNSNSGASTNADTAGTTQTLSFPAFYNPAMLKDSDSSNDFNFGFNPVGESKTADIYDAEFRNRIKIDPALGAASMAWVDANLGTRFMGVFYDEVDQKWDAAINYAKERFMKDQLLYYKTLDAFFAFMDTAEKVEVTNAKGIDDQMYMNPYTVDGVPDVIVMETDDQTGHFLTYTFIVKGKTFDVSYRIECGFQPCNVADIMKITPTPRPTSSTASNTTNVTPSNTTPSNTTPKPTPTIPETTVSNPKDPTKGTNVGKNDDPGPGPNTNNGVGAQYSSEEKPTNSTFMTYDEYKETMQELKEVNETQKQGGDPNTPTVTPQPGTNVDSNADKGTGNGGIDVPTPVQEPVHVVTPDGETEPISTDPGTKWDGPVD